MPLNLPATLKDAEDLLITSLIEYLENTTSKKIAVNLKFEGLRLLPVAIRLSEKLSTRNFSNAMAWADAGATALAKRDAPDISSSIYSYKELLSSPELTNTKNLLLCVSPQAYDYEEFLVLCEKYPGKILMINGKLEDSAVGIGSVGRERRKEFISSWEIVYWLEPLSGGAIMRSYPHDWYLFKLYTDGYRFLKTFKDKPGSEVINEELI